MDAITTLDFYEQHPTSAYVAEGPAQIDPCLVDRVAYDIGSNSTKMIAARVNVCQMKIEHVFSQQVYPVQYRTDLQSSSSDEFSEWIKNYGMQTLRMAKLQGEYDHLSISDSNNNLQHCAIATAAFRQAENGEAFTQEIAQTLQIPVTLISQDDEGRLAYFSALSQIGANLEQLPIVWDIGGGSMQITFKDERNEFMVLGNSLASNSFQQLVLETISHKHLDESPNPMSEQQALEALALAKHMLNFDELSQMVIRNRIAQGSPVLAVGQVHNLVIQPLSNYISQTQGNTYTKDQIANAINLLANKTDDEIMGMMAKPDQEHVKNQLTNLILVYAGMDNLGINQVHTIETSNATGLLLKGC